MINPAQKPSHLNRREALQSVGGERRTREARPSC